MEELPNKILLETPEDVIVQTEERIIRFKDISQYVPRAYYDNYCVIDDIIRDDGAEIGLKVKLEYPAELEVGERGMLDVKVFTKDFKP